MASAERKRSSAATKPVTADGFGVFFREEVICYGAALRETRLAVLEHPEQLEMLRRNPLLIGSAVEELLRYTSPVQMATERYAREDVPIAGTTIPRGDLVLAVLGSANRDERRFESPDALNVDGELPDTERPRRAESPGTLPHQLRAAEGIRRGQSKARGLRIGAGAPPSLHDRRNRRRRNASNG